MTTEMNKNKVNVLSERSSFGRRTSLEECLKTAERLEAGISTSVWLKNTNYTKTAHSNTHNVQQFNSKFTQQKSKFTAKVSILVSIVDPNYISVTVDIVLLRTRNANSATKSLILQKYAEVPVRMLLSLTLWKKFSIRVTLTVNSLCSSILQELFI